MPKASPDVPPALSAWMAELASVWPGLSRPQIKVLAQYSLGMVLAEGSGLSRVTFCLAHWLAQSCSSVRERLRDFYCGAKDKSGEHRRELLVADCFAGLLAWILRFWPSEHLAIAMDASTLGNRFVVLAISVVYGASAIPVAWKILPATAKEAWKPHWLRLLRKLKGVVPPEMQVIVLADRGLYAKWLFEAIVELKWHPFLRINRDNAQFQPTDTGKYRPLNKVITATGQAYAQAGVMFRSRKARLACTLVACWSEGYEEPWLVVTDLPADQTEPAWYGLRTWIERGFKHGKSGGLRWQNTRMTDPRRSERLWLVMAVAQVLAMRQGTIEHGRPTQPTGAGNAPTTASKLKRKSPRHNKATASSAAKRRHSPMLSVFLGGLLLARLLLCAGIVLPNHPLSPAPWPTGLPKCTATAESQVKSPCRPP
jgi:hypothetical protein